MTLGPETLCHRHARLEPLAVDHVEGLFRAAQDLGDTARLTTVPISAEDAHAYVQRALAARDAGLCLPFAIRSVATNHLVGSTRLTSFEWWDWGTQTRPARPGPDSLELGWTWLARPAQRTPINTESKWLLLNHAFDQLNVERVLIKTDARNARSRAAIERIGATFEGILRRHLPAADGGVRDTAVFSIVAPEWPTVRDALRAKVET